MNISKEAFSIRKAIVDANVEHCKDLTPEQIESIIRLNEIKNLKEQPLLQIELQDINSVPRVIYKGEEIKNKMEVAFEWDTGTIEAYTPAYVRIKHWDKEVDKRMNSKTIQHNEQIF
ncbi:hypothetical protein LCM23_25580 [Cytobacillus kochii]|uniref:hypothetical protein n=1 Tax=Cytobacillus kochii TaxID=859143 RepID=UPI001CD7048E|nr:hypothetical protein [Cytobacillus kochii]MCA1029387.1 hypothetical protein [Cytobacillus kochii]